MKNVLLLGSELGKGGAERSISLLSYYLEQIGYNITLCILSGTDREQYYKTCKNVVFIDPPKHTSISGKINAWRHRLKKVRELKRDQNIDVSISFLEGPDYVNVLTRGKEKIVLSIRGSKMHDKVIAGAMGTIRKKVLIPYLYKRADEVACVTQALADELHEHFGIKKDKLKVIYNFYETEVIRKAAEEALTTEEQRIYERPVIITSGRLHMAKEQDKLIHILKRIQSHKHASLMILGDGELKNFLISLCNDLGLVSCDWNGTYEDADVYLMGFQQNAFKYYKHSSLFALASSWEGFPNVLAEALICEIPVVSTDCPTGPREILNIDGLTKAPTKAKHRISAGTLLPMLDSVNEEVLDMWAEEVVYWLNAPKPNDASFSQLTKRFTLVAMLEQWKQIIENR